ncbi:hypothetical protein SAMN04515695_2304 [Pseudovibrio sp. Tun.PSC04-5.I4]|nr:hypothetical protein SAMN04515695_2304 [Pseudovibrio sp. Tun.PSC04-5.I4]
MLFFNVFGKMGVGSEEGGCPRLISVAPRGVKRQVWELIAAIGVLRMRRLLAHRLNVRCFV